MKTYLVVGGTSGIGLETTKLLSQNNRVIVLSRDKRNLDGLSNVEFHSSDVTKSTDELPQIDGSIRWISLLSRHNKFKTSKEFKNRRFSK